MIEIKDVLEAVTKGELSQEWATELITLRLQAASQK